MAPIVTILTDFGNRDPYVGIMKGVIARIAPEARTIDLTHLVPPGDILAGSLALLQAVPFYPPGTVHLVVVDPGVGSHRKPIAAAAGSALFVGPDNGVFTYVFDRLGFKKAVELANPAYRLPAVSNTFHGRDVFAPAAAHLAAGVALDALGPEVAEPERLPLPRFEERDPGVILGEVLPPDHFGNLPTSIGWLDWEALAPWLPVGISPRRFPASQAHVSLKTAGGGQTALDGIYHTFSDVARDELVAIIGSERHLDIVVNRGSAQEKLGAQTGDEVVLHLPRG
jgi:S-adenosylmethionine hydrolase